MITPLPEKDSRSIAAFLRRCLIAGIFSIGYLALSFVLIGFKPDQITLIALFSVCYIATKTTRRFIIGFSIYIVYWIIFDYMKAFPNYNYNAVHIKSIYNFEKSIFSVYSNQTLLTFNEYCKQFATPFLDVICGLFYLSWVPFPLAFSAYLFFKRRIAFFHFALTFFLVNLIGFVIYYIYPAAPPWYVQQHGFQFIANTPGNVGGLERFDQFFNIRLFHGMYEKNSNVFAAMPSLHSAFPVIVLFHGIKNQYKYINIFFAIIMLGIWFAAVYTSHHYVVDVLAGITCAITAIIVYEKVLLKTKWFNQFINAYMKVTE